MALGIDHSVDRSLSLTLVLFGMVVVGAADAAAATWETELSHGQPISVDPTTNRVIIQSGVGQGRPLWNGVHRLRDGSTITIRSGIVVPNEALSGALPAPPPVADPSANPTPDAGPTSAYPAASTASAASPTAGRDGNCDHLVLKTCGLDGGCEAHEACELAQQLRQMRQQSVDPQTGNSGWAENRCHEALQDDVGFTACDQEPPLETIACHQLVRHVCAAAGRCSRSAMCRNARELFDLEQAALDEGATEELTLIRDRCVEILGRHAFFPPCR